MDNNTLDVLVNRIKELEKKLERIETRDHVDWNNPLTLGNNLSLSAGDIIADAGIIRTTGFYSFIISSLLDDNVTYCTPSNKYGIAVLNLRISTYSDFWGIVNFRLSATTFCIKCAGGTALNVNTVSGVPVYSSYTDNFVTVVASDNGNLYVVNRRGGTIQLGITILGA